MTGQPPRSLGGYARLWSASTVSTWGDGIYLTALPLLAAQLTRDPLQIGVVASVGFLPWLLVGPVSGVLVDRWDRRRVMWSADLTRALIVSGLGAAILFDAASIPLLLTVGFGLGVGQTLYDGASQAIIPELVGREQHQLEHANGRLLGAQQVSQEFIGPPTGGALFSITAGLPFLADALSFAASSALVASIRGSYRPQRSGERRRIRTDLAEGFRYLIRHRLLRCLAITAGVSNIAFMAGESVLVLFAQDKLGLGSIGFGLLLTGQAVGGVLGSLLAARISRTVGPGVLLIGLILVEAAAAVGFGLASTPVLAGMALALTGAAVTITNVVTQSIRQGLVPAYLMGRVIAAFRMVGFGSIPLGALLGGLIAREYGLRAPFLVGAVILAVLALSVWPIVNNRTIQGSA